MKTSIPVLLLGMSLATGCGSLSASPDEGITTAMAITNEVKDVPAVNRQRYPDNIGFLYQTPLATMFWLQNVPDAVEITDLNRRIGRIMEQGLAGEIIADTMQRMDPVPDTEPTLPELAKRTVQTITALTQFSYVSSDYGDKLSTALSTYNSDPARIQGLKGLVAEAVAALNTMATADPPGGPALPPPPPPQRVLQPGKFFADAVKDSARASLVRSVARLQRSIDARNAAAYATAYIDVFFTQLDIDLTKLALEGLAVHHKNGVLTGQPLDKVVAIYTSRSFEQAAPYSGDQLCLINQINLISNDTARSRRPLVAALLLIDEHHRQQEQDVTLSTSLIWQHIADASWLVEQYVRIKADGTTADQVNAEIDNLVASL